MKKSILILAAALLGAFGAAAQQAEYITYEMFGAVGDGVADDMPAIIAAHEAANAQGIPVRVSDRTYFISGASRVAVIRTDTDFGTAHFIIDDRSVDDRTLNVFEVRSYEDPFDVEGIRSLKVGAKKLGVKLPCEALVEIANDDRKIYIREGLNQNAGTPQREVLLASGRGRVSKLSKTIWQYDTVTSARAYPVDLKPLTIRGGVFTTIANQDESRYNYYSRGILVARSNTVVEGFRHYVEGEVDHGAPYRGFLNIEHCVGVVVKDCVFTGRKKYWTIGAAGLPVPMGSYDLSITSAVNITIEDCTQTNDLDNRDYWGLMGSNFCKSLTFERCRITRFDAHQGVWNVTLRDCVFGHMYARAVGSGKLTIERCEMRFGYLFGLRDDYGSSWDGDIYIKDCVMRPVDPDTWRVEVIHGKNNGTHDFGYQCRLPRKIVVDGLLIDDSRVVDKRYQGPVLFSPFDYSPDATQPFPAEGTIKLRGVEVVSGRPFAISHNSDRFCGYKIL